jgi:integrase
MDARGWRRSKATMRGYHKGPGARKQRGRTTRRPPQNATDVLALIAACGDSLQWRRERAPHGAVWRTGMRMLEALALVPEDVNRIDGTIVTRRGKGGDRRRLGMDSWAREELDMWLAPRKQLRWARSSASPKAPPPIKRDGIARKIGNATGQWSRHHASFY